MIIDTEQVISKISTINSMVMQPGRSITICTNQIELLHILEDLLLQNNHQEHGTISLKYTVIIINRMHIAI